MAIEDECDAWIRIGAPENTRDGADLDSELQNALAKAGHPLVSRRLALEIPWVTCRYPTPAMAQDAGMGLKAFEDFLFGSVLLDWDAEGAEDGADQGALRLRQRRFGSSATRPTSASASPAGRA